MVLVYYRTISCVDRKSTNLINELYSYEYIQDKYGYVLDKPVDFNNHLLDAARYVAMMKLSLKQLTKGNAYAVVRGKR